MSADDEGMFENKNHVTIWLRNFFCSSLSLQRFPVVEGLARMMSLREKMFDVRIRNWILLPRKQSSSTSVNSALFCDRGNLATKELLGVFTIRDVKLQEITPPTPSATQKRCWMVLQGANCSFFRITTFVHGTGRRGDVVIVSLSKPTQFQSEKVEKKRKEK